MGLIIFLYFCTLTYNESKLKLTTVAHLKPGQRGIIRGATHLPAKLMELGCLPGNEVVLLRVAPLNDPLYINLNGSHIAIRRATALQIELEILEDI